ncbi:MAG: hypothetical protein Fur005_34620 [Roseiflexaceae bacterium]
MQALSCLWRRLSRQHLWLAAACGAVTVAEMCCSGDGQFCATDRDNWLVEEFFVTEAEWVIGVGAKWWNAAEADPFI